jgi:hypothetical protein
MASCHDTCPSQSGGRDSKRVIRTAIPVIVLTTLFSCVCAAEPTEPANAAALQQAAAAPAHASPGPSQEPRTILETLSLPTDFQQTAALYRLLSQADVDALTRFIDEAKTIQNPRDRDVALFIIYGRLADLDPHQALSHLMNSGAANVRNTVRSVFFSWSKVALDDAIETCNQLENPAYRSAAIDAIFAAHLEWSTSDLARLAERLGPDADRVLKTITGRRLVEMSQTNPKRAMDEALAETDPDFRREWLSQIGVAWAESDPVAAYEYSLGMEDGQDKASFQQAVLAGLARNDPEGALELIDSGAVNPREWWQVLNNAIQALVQRDPQLAMEKAQSLTNPSRRQQAIHLVLNTVMRSDPDEAIELLDSLSGSPDFADASLQIAPQFAREDFQQALDWASAHSIDHPELLGQVIANVAQYEPDRALEVIEGLPESPARTRAIEATVQGLSYYDKDLALRLFNSLPVGQAKTDVAVNISSNWFQENPRQTLDWILTLDRQLQTELLYRLGGMAVHYDRQFAQDVLPSLPSAYVRNAWISFLVSTVSGPEDAMKMVEWLEPYRDEPRYNEWLNASLQSLASSGSADYALQLADGIRDEAAYERAMLAIVDSWTRVDVKAAAAWVKEESVVADRSELITRVAGEWSRYDLQAAQRWVMGFKLSAERDAGLVKLMESPYLSSQEADALLRNIKSSAQRSTALQTYIERVARYDPGAARRYLDRQVTFSDEKQKLMEIIENAENGVF